MITICAEELESLIRDAYFEGFDDAKDCLYKDNPGHYWKASDAKISAKERCHVANDEE